MGRKIQNKVIEARRDTWVVIFGENGFVNAKPFDIQQDAMDFASYKRENGFNARVLETTMCVHRFSEMLQTAP